tara:strand:- start:271 stop:702 length:432 start_codon:yes stop_codon:yes gene_type:complete
MITNFLKKTKQEEKNIDTDNLIKITALLVHAAKIDDNYTANEKEIIADFLKSTKKNINIEDLIKKAEIEENDSNQILKYTQEIKKNSLEFKKMIIKTLWKIILSDNKSDLYEGNLMRRLAGLLYVSDKLCGEIKLEALENKKV